MVVNTLKISFCADHSWREGESRVKVVVGRGGEGKGRVGRWERRVGGEEGGRWVRKGKSALLMKERKKERDVFFRPLPRGAI